MNKFKLFYSPKTVTNGRMLALESYLTAIRGIRLGKQDTPKELNSDFPGMVEYHCQEGIRECVEDIATCLGFHLDPIDAAVHPHYANDDDRKCAHALVDVLVDRGFLVSVWCGTVDDDGKIEYEIHKSQDKALILKNMGASGEDYIHFFHPTINPGQVHGWFRLIYCNGSEGEPMVLIADYVADAMHDGIYGEVERKLEGKS